MNCGIWVRHLTAACTDTEARSVGCRRTVTDTCFVLLCFLVEMQTTAATSGARFDDGQVKQRTGGDAYLEENTVAGAKYEAYEKDRKERESARASLETFFWIGAALAVAYYFDIVNTMLYDPRILKYVSPYPCPTSTYTTTPITIQHTTHNTQHIEHIEHTTNTHNTQHTTYTHTTTTLPTPSPHTQYSPSIASLAWSSG